MPGIKDPEIISIHAPRVGSDERFGEIWEMDKRFQSTLPVWGATVCIYAMRYAAEKFQSTLPVWGATQKHSTACASCLFQSTLPVWGATLHDHWRATDQEISIHAPRVGSDRCNQRLGLCGIYFNPRSPCGERLRSSVHCGRN